MVRAQCPPSLRKFGFCGVLAVIYAARLPMPSSVAKMQALLDEMKEILSLKKSKWKSSDPRRTGNISLSDTVCLLRHYQACEYTVELPQGAAPTLNKWLKSLQKNTCYIVHVKKHALFVEVGAVKSKWRIYDQSGARSKENMASLERVGGFGRRHIVALIKISHPTAPTLTAQKLSSTPLLAH
jgi:hypothetical protein